jgi:serine/threonine protein phosphatase PrpC
MLKIITANFISELGKRSNNEDNCAINPNKTYIVCDGVGGSEKGEIASDIVVREFIKLYDENPDIKANDAIKNVDAKLTNHINQHPETMGMATTLTLAQIKKDSIYVAWCGDSRIYQFRNGKIIFKTIDHSWVNEAVKAGIITEEEAVNHPKSNVITRAIQGQHKPVLIEDLLLTDIESYDTFLLCSDGVLESWNDDDLEALFTSEKNVDTILQKIKSECSIHSRDNFTAIVFKLDEVDKSNRKSVYEPKTTPIIIEEIVTNTDREKSQLEYNSAFEKKYNQTKQKKKSFFILLALVLTIVFTLIAYFIFNKSDSKENKRESKNELSKKKEKKDKLVKEDQTVNNKESFREVSVEAKIKVKQETKSEVEEGLKSKLEDKTSANIK